MKLVVGLGNPGSKYEKTRHNAGFWWLDLIANQVRTSFNRESRFQGATAKVLTRQGESSGDVWLLKPETFMNNSGQAVASLANYFKISAKDILVAHDELDLLPGAVKLKFGGGLSGHNGLKSIAANLGTQDFWRLRLGIGHPRDNAASEREVVDYVLHAPRAEEHEAIDEAMSRALEVWPQIVADEMEAAMLTLHTR